MKREQLNRSGLSRREIDDILNKAHVCRLALARNGEPYLVPVFFGYDGKRLYFHTAGEGKKLDIVAVNNRVCFEVERSVAIRAHPSEACKWTAAFESIIGFGNIFEILAPEGKEYGLNQIMRHYSGREWHFKPEILEKTRVWYVEIESLTGKRSDPEHAAGTQSFSPGQ